MVSSVVFLWDFCVRNLVCLCVCMCFMCFSLGFFFCLSVSSYSDLFVSLLYYNYFLDACLYANEARKKGYRFGWVGKYRRYGKSCGMGNNNQNLLY